MSKELKERVDALEQHVTLEQHVSEINKHVVESVGTRIAELTERVDRLEAAADGDEDEDEDEDEPTEPEPSEPPPPAEPEPANDDAPPPTEE